MSPVRSALSIVVFLALAWVLSSHRRRFPWRTVLTGLGFQFAIGMVVLRTDIGAHVFSRIGDGVAKLIEASDKGAEFVFGNLVKNNPDAWGFVFAAKALPTIIFFSSLSAIGYHFGILQQIVAGMAWIMKRVMGTSGAETLSAAANVFMGQTEAPLFVRPYIPRMTESELNALMIGGFATIAGSLMAVYAGMLGHNDSASISNMARHLLTASLMSAPAGLVVAKILVPETGTPDTAGTVRLKLERTTRNVIDAAAQGALDGMKLALNVAAMLIAFIALLAIIDICLNAAGQHPYATPVLDFLGLKELSLKGLLGIVFWPVAELIGIEAKDARLFAGMIGEAMAANEFIAYKSLDEMARTSAISPRSQVLAVYTLCGFANFSSIAIQIAGIGGMAPERYHDLARLGLRAMLGGAIACWMTACVAGMMM